MGASRTTPEKGGACNSTPGREAATGIGNPERILAIPGTPGQALTIRSGVIDAGDLAKLSTVVAPELASIVGNITTALDLTLFADCHLSKAGDISASGTCSQYENIDTKLTPNR